MYNKVHGALHDLHFLSHQPHNSVQSTLRDNAYGAKTYRNLKTQIRSLKRKKL